MATVILEKEIERLNNILEGLCIVANGLREPDMQPWFDCYVELLNFSEKKSFEENIKDFFIESAKGLEIRKPSNYQYRSNWNFKMDSLDAPTQTINRFFHVNLFSGLNTVQVANISDSLIEYVERLIGAVVVSKHGYIAIPWEYNRYCQHWKHLYLKGEKAEILITFEANT